MGQEHQGRVVEWWLTIEQFVEHCRIPTGTGGDGGYYGGGLGSARDAVRTVELAERRLAQSSRCAVPSPGASVEAGPALSGLRRVHDDRQRLRYDGPEPPPTPD